MTTAIRAETFNPATLFLLGTPALGAERLVLDVAHAQRAPLYVNKAKLKVREKRNSSSERNKQRGKLEPRMDKETTLLLHACARHHDGSVNAPQPPAEPRRDPDRSA